MKWWRTWDGTASDRKETPKSLPNERQNLESVHAVATERVKRKKLKVTFTIIMNKQTAVDEEK